MPGFACWSGAIKRPYCLGFFLRRNESGHLFHLPRLRTTELRRLCFKVFPRITSVEKQRICCVRPRLLCHDWVIDWYDKHFSKFFNLLIPHGDLIFNNPSDKIYFKRVSLEFWKQLHLRDREDLWAEKFARIICETWNFQGLLQHLCGLTQSQAMSEKHKGGRKTTCQPRRSNYLQQVLLT